MVEQVSIPHNLALLLQEISLPEREEGEYTVRELARFSGKPYHTMYRAMERAVAAGKCSKRMCLVDGRNCCVYRVNNHPAEDSGRVGGKRNKKGGAARRARR